MEWEGGQKMMNGHIDLGKIMKIVKVSCSQMMYRQVVHCLRKGSHDFRHVMSKSVLP